MNWWNRFTGGVQSSKELPAKGIDGGKASLFGMTIRAGVYVSPLRATPEKHGPVDYHLVQSMGQLSLGGGASVEGSSSSVFNVALVADVPKCREIFDEVDVPGRHKDGLLSYSSSTGTHESQSYDYGIKGTKQHLYIAPRTTLLNALKSVGIVDPIFMHVGFKGAFQVHIQFESPLPICLETGTNFADISGEVCCTLELAETSAVKKAFDHLYKMHNVVLYDISYRKMSEHRKDARNKYCDVSDGLRYVSNMIQDWNDCLHKLYQVEKLAYPKQKWGSEIDKRFCGPLIDFMMKTKSDSIEHINSSDAKLKQLTDRKDEWLEGSRYQGAFYCKASKIKAYHYEVDVLNLLLQYLGLDECQVGAEVDEGQYTGSIMISFPEGQTIHAPEDVCIEADQEDNNRERAINRAARKAISWLEDLFDVEVIGLNHNETMVAEHELSVISQIRQEVMLLGATVALLWEDMLNTVGDFVVAQKHTANLIAPEPGFIHNLAVQFELASGKCIELYKQSPTHTLGLLCLMDPTAIGTVPTLSNLWSSLISYSKITVLVGPVYSFS